MRAKIREVWSRLIVALSLLSIGAGGVIWLWFYVSTLVGGPDAPKGGAFGFVAVFLFVGIVGLLKQKEQSLIFAKAAKHFAVSIYNRAIVTIRVE